MAYASEVLADTPLAYYRLGESSGTAMLDSSGNGRHGTYTGVALGAASLLTSTSDTAATFDGADFGNVPYDTWQAPTAALTYEAWVRPASVAAGNRLLIGRSNLGSTSDNNYHAYIFQAAGSSFKFFVRTTTGNLEITAPLTIASGQVYHLVGTYDGSFSRLYINGTQAVSAAKTGTLTSGGTNPLRIGAVNFNGMRFIGDVDEAAIYGAALPAARILTHYNEGTTTAPPSGAGFMSLSGFGQSPVTSSALMSIAGTGVGRGVITLDASPAGETTVSGDLELETSNRSLEAQAFGQSSVSGDLAVDRAVAGSSAGSSSVAGNLGRAHEMETVSAGASSVSGEMTVPRSVQIEGTSMCSAWTSGDLYVRRYTLIGGEQVDDDWGSNQDRSPDGSRRDSGPTRRRFALTSVGAVTGALS